MGDVEVLCADEGNNVVSECPVDFVSIIVMGKEEVAEDKNDDDEGNNVVDDCTIEFDSTDVDVDATAVGKDVSVITDVGVPVDVLLVVVVAVSTLVNAVGNFDDVGLGISVNGSVDD